MDKEDKNITINNPLLQKVKDAVIQLEPDAEIYLFGSRARGDFQEDSDWDLLILLPGEIDFARKSKIVNILYDIQLFHNQIFNSIIGTKYYWQSNPLLHQSFLFQEIENERTQL